MINISVGTPRQTFPAFLQILSSNVIINNETIRQGSPEGDGSAEWAPYYGCKLCDGALSR